MTDISSINMEKVLTGHENGEMVVDLLEDLQAARDNGEGTNIQKPFRDQLRKMGWYMNKIDRKYLVNGKPAKSVTKKMAKRKDKTDKNYVLIDGIAYSPDNVPGKKRTVKLSIPKNTVTITIIANKEETVLHNCTDGDVYKFTLE